MSNSEMPDFTDDLPLHFAAQAGDLTEMRRLLDGGADVNALDRNGNTALKYASAEPRPEAMRLLIQHGAAVNLADNYGFTPLHCAAGHGFYDEALEMVELLISHGADVNGRSRVLGFVPLHEARGTEIIDALLRHGADPRICNDAGQTPLEYMIEQEATEESDHLARRLDDLRRA